jgi:hypothetical protein
MPSSVDLLQPQEARAISIYEAPLAKITPALRFGTQLRSRDGEFSNIFFGHERGMVPYAREHRTKWLAQFGPAVAASSIITDALNVKLERKVATMMISTMLGAFGAKVETDVLIAMLDMLESNDVADASGLWTPVDTAPAVLSLACRKLIASNTFKPKPAELREACREASNSLWSGLDASNKLVDFVRRCDVLLLEFDHDEWERPYLTPQYRLILPKMLELHESEGDGSDAWLLESDWDDDDGNPTHQLARLIRAEKLAIAPPPERKRIAAARKRNEAKRSGKTTRTRKAKPVEADQMTGSNSA